VVIVDKDIAQAKTATQQLHANGAAGHTGRAITSPLP